MHIYGWSLVAVALALFVGAALQGVIGFGMVALSFPVLVLANQALLPQTVLVVSFPIVMVMLVRNWGEVLWSEVGWIAIGRLPGIGLAILLLGVLAPTALSLLGGCTVIAAVAISRYAPPVRHTRANLIGVGAISGTFGTAIAIGGPPLGLLYQHESGPRLRSTVSVLMAMGAPISLVVLMFTGNLSPTDIRTGLALMPAGLAGIFVAPRLHEYFDQRLRTLVLSVCAFSAVAAMAKILLI